MEQCLPMIKRSIFQLLILTALFMAASVARVLAEDRIKIGVMFHLTGDFAAWGEAYMQGADIAREATNASGGVNGKQVDFIVEDIRFDSRMSATASKKLLEIDKVPAAMIT